MVRRRVAAAVAVVALIVIVLLINGCLKSEKRSSLESYNRKVGQLAGEWNGQVAEPLFTALTDASAKSALDVGEKVNQLLITAKALTSQASGLSVPGEMVSAQRDLLLAFGLRLEGMTKLAALVPSALGGQAKQAAGKIAGAMETFLASDVVYSQRVAPLIQQALRAEGISVSTTGSRFLANVGWLETSTVLARMTGSSPTGSSTSVAPGTHGSALIGVAVGTESLQAEPALNKIKGGGTPTFTVTVENTGSNAETNVKVQVGVTIAGKTLTDSHVINSTTPGQKANVEIPVEHVTLGVAATVKVEVLPVPGETNTENNKASYLAIFSE